MWAASPILLYYFGLVHILVFIDFFALNVEFKYNNLPWAPSTEAVKLSDLLVIDCLEPLVNFWDGKLVENSS